MDSKPKKSKTYRFNEEWEIDYFFTMVNDKCCCLKPKKSKTYRFNEEWEIDYFFTMVNDKCCCLICVSSIAIAKKGNLERHFLALHNKYQTDYPPNSELRKKKT
ncbi:Spin-doc zinc-finger [Popillia japonica]|uniref:Spin-doc zinc-finger n=1 Tax=Popillia japonica TaxID=7064 RepID=A0AAW1IBL6_POPJA